MNELPLSELGPPWPPSRAPSSRASQSPRSPARRGAIIASYVALFWIALPALLFQLGARFDQLFALPAASPGMRLAGSALLALSALALARAMLALLREGRGLPISHLPPTHLVTRGAYGRVRHPIYVAFTLAFSGLALLRGSYGAAVGSGAVLTLGWIAYVTLFEEPRLYARFGDAYRQYAQGTRLLPIVPPFVERYAMRAWRAAAPRLERLANLTTLYRGPRASFVTYGAFVGAGAFAMVLFSCASLAASGAAAGPLAVFALATGCGMLAGGRLTGLLYRAPLLRRDPLQALRTVGFVSYGGYAGMALAACATAPQLALPWPPSAVLERLLLPGLVCSAIGRFGCLSYGCCGGRPWAAGIHWHNPDARIVRELGARAGCARIPTQLLSSAHALAAAALLAWAGTHPLPAGAFASLAALLYGLGRAILEQTREEARFTALQLTRGQLIALALAGLGVYGLLAAAPAPLLPPIVSTLPLPAFATALPIAACCALLTALVTGIHGPRVGHW